MEQLPEWMIIPIAVNVLPPLSDSQLSALLKHLQWSENTSDSIDGAIYALSELSEVEPDWDEVHDKLWDFFGYLSDYLKHHLNGLGAFYVPWEVKRDSCVLRKLCHESICC